MRHILFFFFLMTFSTVIAQENQQTGGVSSRWGVYGGYQSLQISGIEDDASEDELNTFSTERLGSYYIGFWRNTDWTISSLPITIGAELGHRGTSTKIDSDFEDDGLDLKFDILITYLDLWASANYAMSDKFNLWFGPMLGIHLDEKVKFFGLDIGEIAEVDFDFDENDYGFLMGAGYSISEKISINAGIYRGLKDHDGGKFNNLFLDIGYSF